MTNRTVVALLALTLSAGVAAAQEHDRSPHTHDSAPRTHDSAPRATGQNTSTNNSR